MKNLVVIVIYPAAEKYLEQLVDSLNKQTTKDFEVIFFNDQVENENSFLQKASFLYRVEEIKGSPNDIRFRMLEKIKGIHFQNIIFQDADDMLSPNRVEVNQHYLEKYSFVCNDIDLADENGVVFEKRTWSGRLNNKFVFGAEWLIDKNIVGLGNTAMRQSMLQHDLVKPAGELIATDWFIFYQLIQKSGSPCLFTNECTTIYRQHGENTVGLTAISKSRLNHSIKVKQAHYKALNDAGYDFNEKLQAVVDLSKNENNLFNNLNYPLFWWEETASIK